MERKVITSMLTGHLISMLPVWEIGSRIQALTLTFALFCVHTHISDLDRGSICEHKKSSHVRQRESKKKKQLL